MGKDRLCDRIQAKMDEASPKIRQVDIVRITGAGKSTVSQWLAGIKTPGPVYLTMLSELFGVSVNWLLNGKDGTIGPEKAGLYPYKPRKIPLISWVQAGTWTDTGCDDPAMNCSEWTETTANVSERAFALLVRGDSMTSLGNPRSIAEGAKVVVEPVFDPLELNRKIVVAMIEGSVEATIKEFIQDGMSKYLRPFNPSYQSLQITDSCRIVGVVKQIIIDL